jgi:hypothetical protein
MGGEPHGGKKYFIGFLILFGPKYYKKNLNFKFNFKVSACAKFGNSMLPRK